MKNSGRVISKVLVVSLLISVFLLEGCGGGLGNIDISGLPPEMQMLLKEAQKALDKQKEDLERKELDFKKKQEEDAELKQKEAEEYKKQQEELEKQKQQEEKERLRLEAEKKRLQEALDRKEKEDKERLEREEKERKRKEEEELKKQKEAIELEKKLRLLEEKNRKKLDKENLKSEIQRVARIIKEVDNNQTQLEKIIEDLTPHGKIINQALKDRLIGYNLRLGQNDALTNTDIAILVNHPRLEKIVEFKLDSLILSKPQLRALLSCLDNLRRKLSHNKELHISYDQLAVAKVSNLLPLFQIEDRGFSYLTLHGGKVQDDQGIIQDLGQNIDKLVRLQYLRFNNTCFLTLAPSLKNLPDLRYLNLYGCGLGDTGMQALAPCFKGITYLVGLDLSSNNLGPVGAQALAAHLQDLPNLREFKLDLNSNIGLEGIKAIAPQLRYLRKLLGLSLFNTLVHAGAAGAKVLAPHLPDLLQLGTLNLQSNNLGDEGLQAFIPSLHNLTKLYRLSFVENQLSSVSARSLVQYLNTTKPSNFRLYLGKNQLGDTGAQAFLNLPKDVKSWSIYLECNNISDEMVSNLRQLSHIEWSTKISLGTEYNPNLEPYSILNLNVDSYKTSSKKSILDSK